MPPAPTSLDGFAIFAREWIVLGAGSHVAGDVGVEAEGWLSGPERYRLIVGRGAIIDAAHTASADSILLDGGSTGPLRTDHLLDRGGTHGTVDVFPEMPRLPPGGGWDGPPPSTLYTIPKHTTIDLEAGAYRDVLVDEGATILLTGSMYDFDSLELRGHAKIDVAHGARVIVRGRLDAREHTTVGSTAAGQRHPLRIEVRAADSGKRQTAVSFGAGSTIFADLYAPRGTVAATRSSVSGRIVANGIDLLGTTVSPPPPGPPPGTCTAGCAAGQALVACGDDLFCATPKNQIGASCSTDPCSPDSLCGSIPAPFLPGAAFTPLGCEASTNTCQLAAGNDEPCGPAPCADGSACFSLGGFLFDAYCVARGAAGDGCIEGILPCERDLTCTPRTILPVGVSSGDSTCGSPCVARPLGERCASTGECQQPGPGGVGVICGLQPMGEFPEPPTPGLNIAYDCCVPPGGACNDWTDCCATLGTLWCGGGDGTGNTPGTSVPSAECTSGGLATLCVKPAGQSDGLGQCGGLTSAPPTDICPFFPGQEGISTNTDPCGGASCGKEGATCPNEGLSCGCCFGFLCGPSGEQGGEGTCVCGGVGDHCPAFSNTAVGVNALCCPDLQCVPDPVNGPTCQPPAEGALGCVPIGADCVPSLPCCEGTCEDGKCPCRVTFDCMVNGAQSYLKDAAGVDLVLHCCSDFYEMSHTLDQLGVDHFGECCTPNSEHTACCTSFDLNGECLQ
jgi:hypothetical protein